MRSPDRLYCIHPCENVVEQTDTQNDSQNGDQGTEETTSKDKETRMGLTTRQRELLQLKIISHLAKGM
jgi:hypothetical protein